MLRSRVLAVPLILLVAMSLTGCGSVVDRVRDVVHQATSGDDVGSDDGDEGPPPNTDIVDLVAGDCFLEPWDDVPTAVDKVACDEEHEYEVTASVPVPGDAFPGDLRVDKLGQIDCRDALVAYVGRDFVDSSLDDWYFTPDATSWNKGMHSIVCLAYAWEGDTLDESVKGSRL